MKKIIIALIVLVVLGAAGWFAYTRLAAGSAAPGEAMLFETTALEKGSLTATIDALGKVRSGQSAEFKWETSGTVEVVLVSAGQQVRKGDVLARLMETSLPEEVIPAQADLTKAEQELEDLRLNADTSSIEAMQDIVTYEQTVRDAQYALDNFTIPTSQAGLSAVEAMGVADGEVLGVADTVRDGDVLGVADGDVDGVAETVAEGEVLGVAEGVADSVQVMLGVALLVRDGVADRVADTVREGVALGDCGDPKIELSRVTQSSLSSSVG